MRKKNVGQKNIFGQKRALQTILAADCNYYSDFGLGNKHMALFVSIA